MTEESEAEYFAKDFLGRWFLLVMMCAGMPLLFATGYSLTPAAGFLAFASFGALFFTLRLTWDKRCSAAYKYIIAGFAGLHALAIAMFYSHFSRDAGGVFALGALVDAVVMTSIIRMSLKDSRPKVR